jgi:preprotein translocase subunit SecD
MNKKIIMAVVIAAFIGLVIFGTTTIQAQTTKPNGFTNIISSLAKKLGIGEDRVQSAFDSIRDERQAQMQKAYEERLNQLVKDGKITEAQKKLILAKHQEMQKNQQANKNKMQTQRQELLDWAKKNNIDPQYLFGFSGRGKMGFGRKGMRGGWMK